MLWVPWSRRYTLSTPACAAVPALQNSPHLLESSPLLRRGYWPRFSVVLIWCFSGVVSKPYLTEAPYLVILMKESYKIGPSTANCNLNAHFFQFQLKMQKEWRISPEKRRFSIESGHLFCYSRYVHKQSNIHVARSHQLPWFLTAPVLQPPQRDSTGRFLYDFYCRCLCRQRADRALLPWAIGIHTANCNMNDIFSIENRQNVELPLVNHDFSIENSDYCCKCR